LLEIKERDGALPKVFVYLDSGSRPLRYAVKPLLDALYAENLQTPPREVFLKVFSQLSLEKDHDETIQRWHADVHLLRQERQQLLEDRQALLRAFGITRDRAQKEQFSQQAHLLFEKAHQLKAAIETKEQHLSKLQSDVQEIVQARVKEIAGQAGGGSFMIVDDLLGQGRSIKSVESAFAHFGLTEHVHYFLFVASSENFQQTFPTIDPQRVAIGVEVGELDSEASNFSDRVGYIPPGNERQFIDGFEWTELASLGFPFRLDKEAATGVLKDQSDPSRYVRRSSMADPAKMKNMRDTYRAWGGEAVRLMNQEKQNTRA